MPELKNNNKGQPATGGAGVDYRPLVSTHYNADETSDTDNLIDATGTEDINRSVNLPGVVADGARNGARGICSGSHASAPFGFIKVPVTGGPWDTRQSAPGNFTKGTLIGWGRLQAGHGDDVEFMNQRRAAGAQNTRAWILRGVQLFDVDHEGPVFLGYDAIGGSNVLSTGFGGPPAGALIPHDTWYMIGFSIDFTVPGNGKLVKFVGIPTLGEFSHTVDPVPANLFSHTVLDQNLMVGVDSGHSSGGQGFEVDHISWMKGYAFADQTEFSQFYNNGAPLQFPNGFNLCPNGGKINHNDHGRSGNTHGDGGNR